MKIYNVVMYKEDPQIFKTIYDTIVYVKEFVFDYVYDNSGLDLYEDEEEIEDIVNNELKAIESRLNKAKNQEVIMIPIIEDTIVIRVFEI